MLIATNGDLFASGCQCLVNAVNCEGVMGGGIALAFKERFPEYFHEYRELCRGGDIKTGTVAVHATGLTIPQFIISFPTKSTPRLPSKLEYVISALPALRRAIEGEKITSIAIPALGCGLGGLSWDTVKPLIIQELIDVDCDIFLFEPRD